MYSTSYDDYIRSILGYNQVNPYADEQYFRGYQSNAQMMNSSFNQNNNQELEQCYPEIYKVVYPMVKRACQNVNTSVTKEMIDKMTDELYVMVEGNDDCLSLIHI